MDTRSKNNQFVYQFKLFKNLSKRLNINEITGRIVLLRMTVFAIE